MNEKGRVPNTQRLTQALFYYMTYQSAHLGELITVETSSEKNLSAVTTRRQFQNVSKTET